MTFLSWALLFISSILIGVSLGVLGFFIINFIREKLDVPNV